ncbi:tRNA (adenosine(37)-N6)-threonylcarbamoyltransferase complex ATPase subunit type 1 TsaE [Limisalsivibrio acetivorans]|uniref:tRNA (adenosine(37)-N6)-threonylcarbamoyltransferase complex ATPase subunit type 1 TsaE n=1 Tax=Limisalsivibrio acetivorans TaxID=1304888 RepID=UPI0003B3AC94|nr:tRNA (adenosine(37)-N6)-threonylcarbamoyltransferase complex ATPase subunit type 1 TsaE [Limisalsivibrio acetivorans]
MTTSGPLSANSTFRTESPEETAELAAKLIDKLKGRTVFLNGGLGAGKTTFVKAFAAKTGCGSDSSSPTFTLLQRYGGEEHTVLHYDLYRLEHPEELETIGFYESIEEEGTRFIEWAEKFPLEDELEDYIRISIKNPGGNVREFVIEED